MTACGRRPARGSSPAAWLSLAACSSSRRHRLGVAQPVSQAFNHLTAWRSLLHHLCSLRSAFLASQPLSVRCCVDEQYDTRLPTTAHRGTDAGEYSACHGRMPRAPREPHLRPHCAGMAGSRHCAAELVAYTTEQIRRFVSPATACRIEECRSRVHRLSPDCNIFSTRRPISEFSRDTVVLPFDASAPGSRRGRFRQQAR